MARCANCASVVPGQGWPGKWRGGSLLLPSSKRTCAGRPGGSTPLVAQPVWQGLKIGQRRVVKVPFNRPRMPCPNACPFSPARRGIGCRGATLGAFNWSCPRDLPQGLLGELSGVGDQVLENPRRWMLGPSAVGGRVAVECCRSAPLPYPQYRITGLLAPWGNFSSWSTWRNFARPRVLGC